MTKFIKVHFFFYFLTLSTSFFLYHLNIIFLHKFIVIIIIYNISMDVFFKWFNNFFNRPGVNQIILSTIFRFFFSILFIFAYIYFGVENVLLFVLNFLVVYLLFIIFEISILLLNLRHIK